MSDYDDDRIEPSDDEYLEDMIYDETCATETEEEIDILEDEFENELETKPKSAKGVTFMDNIIDNDKLEQAKAQYLQMPKYHELHAIHIHYAIILQKGAMPLIDEEMLRKVYGIELFNNVSLTPETVSMISLIIMNIPICVKKYSHIYNREVEDILSLKDDYKEGYYYIIKQMLRNVTYIPNKIYNLNTIEKIFPIFIKFMQSDIITDKELEEIVFVKKNLTNN